MRAIVDAAVKYHVAIEINQNYRLPKIAFLRMAKDAGAKFSFGSNIHGLGIGNLDYCEQMIEQLQLEPKHIFQPAKRAASPSKSGRSEWRTAMPCSRGSQPRTRKEISSLL
jgi:histidinol phosphatase-like PHP family hydrolase